MEVLRPPLLLLFLLLQLTPLGVLWRPQIVQPNQLAQVAALAMEVQP
jgi:hypothetical protein